MPKIKDLTGKTFGRWTVLYRGENNKNGAPYWYCQCSCDNKTIKLIRGHQLTSGRTKSCGCLTKEITYKVCKKYNVYNLSGDYGIGWTSNTNEPFYFDLEDYDKIRNYCWREDKRGYIVTTLNNYDGKHHNKNLFLHALLVDLEDGKVRDHFDLNKKNNRKSNIRVISQQDNIINRKMQKNNTSGHIGVYHYKNSNKYIGNISKDKISYSERFDSYEEAVSWREEKERELFGEIKHSNCEKA